MPPRMSMLTPSAGVGPARFAHAAIVRAVPAGPRRYVADRSRSARTPAPGSCREHCLDLRRRASRRRTPALRLVERYAGQPRQVERMRGLDRFADRPPGAVTDDLGGCSSTAHCTAESTSAAVLGVKVVIASLQPRQHLFLAWREAWRHRGFRSGRSSAGCGRPS